MKPIIIILAICCFLQAHAQKEEFNLAGISYTLNPAVNLKNPANDQLREVEMDISELKAFVVLPLRLKNGKTTLLVGADYTFLGGPLDNLPSDRKVDANLHALRATLGMNHKFSDYWGIKASLRPTFASDFSGSLASEAFTLQASAILTGITENGIRLGLGLAYTNSFGNPQMVPVLEVSYRTDRFDLIMVGPIQMALRYHFDDVFVGFRVDLQGNKYALNVEDQSVNLAPIESVQFSRYNIGPTFAWKLSDGMRMQWSGGISVKRKLTATNVENSSVDYGLENGAFLKTSIFFGTF